MPLLLLILVATSAAAQDGDPRRYLPDPSDEDWSFLKGAPKTDRWDPVKYIPLRRREWFMTLSGEVRYRPEGFRIRASENQPATIDNYLLQRYLAGLDVHVGPRLRIFAGVQSG